MIEEWKYIEDFPDYQVSNLGRVKSLKFNKEKIMKQRILNNGYLYICLVKNKNYKTVLVHRLVLKSFKHIENSKLFECNHIDGNKLNNNIKNLEWCTRSENEKHAHRTGLKTNKGINNPQYGISPLKETRDKISKSNKNDNHLSYKLKKEHVIKIKRLLKESILIQKEIAKIFKVDPTTISKIKLGITWNDVILKEEE